jgi:TonB-linked SusC/RagA family outer membrane protein
MADRQNPVRLIEENKQNKNYFGRLFGSAYADLQLMPGLHIKTNIGADYALNYARTLQDSYVSGFLSDPTNQVSTSQSYDGNIVWQNTLTYDKTFGKSKLNLLAGEENINYINQAFAGSGQGLAIENINYAYLSAATTNILNSGSGFGYALLSFFGKANYDYDGKYLLSATLRRDGSSRFGSNNQFGTFPAASAGWRLSEESFIKENAPVISDLKLRFGWGQTGNQEIANNGTYTLYSAIYGTNLTGAFDGGTAYDITGAGSGTLPSGFAQIQTGNNNLKWETSTQSNIGLDYGLFNNKITGSFDYFIKNTTGILISPAYLAVLGEGGNTYVNGASMKNQGFEAVVNYANQISHDWGVNISSNISAYRNKVTQLPSNVLSSYPGNGTTQTILGRSINSIYGYVADGLFTTQTQVDNSAVQPGKGLGRIRYKDLNGDGVINNLDQQYIGNFDPKFSYGLNVNVKYKNFNLNFFFQGVQGNSVYNTYKAITDFTSLAPGANWGTRVLQAWTPQNPTSTIPALTLVDNNDEARGSTYYVENGSYCKLRNLQLSYNLNDALKKYKIKNAKIYIQGSNLLTIKSKSYTDPDPENSTNEFPIPVVTTIGFDLSL